MKRILVALVAIGTMLLLSATGAAQTAGSGSGSGLQIAPTRSELTIKPGQSDVVNMNVKNITKGAITAKGEVDDFQPDNETGTPQLLTNEAEPTASSLRSFIATIPEISLAAGETKKVTVTVKVPVDQPAGGYYGVLRYKAFPVNTGLNGGEGEHVSLTASIGHIILVQVPGKITEKLEAASLSAEFHKNPSNFFVHPPDSMRLEVKNIGNSFLKPFGNVIVKDSHGKQVYSYEVNATDPRGNVLPKSGRVFHNDIKNIGSFGHYSAIASVSYGNGGDVLTLKTSFWVVPLWVLLVAIALVIALAVILFFLIRHLRRGERNFRKNR